MAFLIAYVVVGAVLGMVKQVLDDISWARRNGVPFTYAGSALEKRIVHRALVWAAAWPLFLPLLFWGKR